MRRTVDAVVIGAGLLGTSIGLELARKGLKTMVVERHAEVGRGSTRGSRTLLGSFHGTKAAVALALEGRTQFQAWAAHLGNDKPLARMKPVGCALLLAEGDHQGADGLAKLMRAGGVVVESLSGREATAIMPSMRGAKTRVLFECGGGYLTSAVKAARDVRGAAEAAGAVFALGDRVTEVRALGQRNGHRRIGGVTTASGVNIDAGIVVNAAGAHSAHVNLLAGAPLPLTTVPMIHRLIRGEVSTPPGLPVVADLPGGYSICFGATGFDLGPIPRTAEREFIADPDAKPPVPHNFLAERRRGFLKRHPGLRWRNPKVVTTIQDVTVLDRYPIVDRTDLDGYYVAIGMNGRWLQSAPTLAWILSELVQAVEAKRDHDRDPLRLTLPRTRQAFDVGFLSRNRRAIQPEVTGLSCA